MPDTKDHGSAKKPEVIIEGKTLSGGGYIPRKKPARADFTKWARHDRWHIAESAMLILGFEPFEPSDFYWPSPPAPGFDDIYDTASRSIAAGTLRATPIHYLRTRDFLAWAHEKGYRIPRKLEEAVNRFHPIMAVEQTPRGVKDGKTAEPTQERGSLRERVAEIEQAVQEAPVKAKPLLTKQRQSVLKIIIGMAVKKYQYDPAASRNDATGKISRDLESLGIALDPDTVRNWLREAAEEVLPSQDKKT